MILSITVVMAQETPRQMVAMEVGTGTWCQYCPGAALGADDLLEQGYLVAVAENHNGDPFTNNYSNARNSYYNVTGFPTAIFDGKLKVVGGDHTNSMVGSYIPKVNQRMALPAHILMSMGVTESAGTYTAVITMIKIGTITPTDLKLQFVVTQSNIMYNWQGQTHLEHVNRLMVPDQNGTDVSFDAGDTVVVTLQYTLDAAWPVEDVEFIAFVQSLAGKEVQQCVKQAAIDLNVDFTASSTQINNNEQVTFTNNTTGGYIGVPETYWWDIPGATPDTSSAENPTVTYTQCGPHDVSLTVNRGGQIIMNTKHWYVQVGPPVNIVATPGDTACAYQPITLDATTATATSYLWSPGNETTPSITVDAATYGNGAHTFYVTVTTDDGCVQLIPHTIFFDPCLGVNNLSKDLKVAVYPNPSNGQFTVELNAGKTTTVDLKIINTLNATVYEENGVSLQGKLVKPMNLNLPAGLYFLVIRNGEGKTIQKLSITK